MQPEVVTTQEEPQTSGVSQVAPRPLSSPAAQQNYQLPKQGVNLEKIIGYPLFLFGLAMIFFSIWQLYTVFTGQKQPPQVFNVESPAIPLPTAGTSFQLPEGFKLPEGFTLPTAESVPSSVKLLPDDLFNQMINMSIYFLLMMFVSSAGAKIASLGIQMLKEIKVKVRGV